MCVECEGAETQIRDRHGDGRPVGCVLTGAVGCDIRRRVRIKHHLRVPSGVIADCLPSPSVSLNNTLGREERREQNKRGKRRGGEKRRERGERERKIEEKYKREMEEKRVEVKVVRRNGKDKEKRRERREERR